MKNNNQYDRSNSNSTYLLINAKQQDTPNYCNNLLVQTESDLEEEEDSEENHHAFEFNPSYSVLDENSRNVHKNTESSVESEYFKPLEPVNFEAEISRKPTKKYNINELPLSS